MTNVEVTNRNGVKGRRERVIKRLEEQLKAGTKTEPVNRLTKATTGARQIPLEPKDIERIKKELATLKTRI